MTYEEYCSMRDTLNLSDHAVANYSGVSKATLSQWKNGKLEPSKRTKYRLEEFFETYDPNRPDYLIAAHIKPKENNIPAFSTPKLWIESFGVRINDGHPGEMTDRQFDELRKSTEAFAQTWLRIHKIIS